MGRLSVCVLGVVMAGMLGVACGRSSVPAAPVAATVVSTRAVEVTPLVVATEPATAIADGAATQVIEAVATSTPVVVAAPVQAVSTTIVRVPEPTSIPEVTVRPPPVTVKPPPVTVAMTLSLGDRSFAPHQVHGNAGDTVVLTFMGGIEAHTFTVTSLGIDVAIGARETKQFSFVMPVEGEVPFFCRLHGSATSGMHGLLIFH